MTSPVEKAAAGRAGFIVRQYVVWVSGWGMATYVARSPGKALSQAWRLYTGCITDIPFKQFLKMATAERGIEDQRFGEEILVGGQRAFWVSCNRQYIEFVRPDSDVALSSHPLDVLPVEARRGTPYYEPATPFGLQVKALIEGEKG